MRPVVSNAAEELYSSLGVWADEDTVRGSYNLLKFCEGLVGGSRLADTQDIVYKSGGRPGWSRVVTVEVAPSPWLPWLAQLVGARLREGMPEIDQRSFISSVEGFRRGTPAAVAIAAQRRLTGDKIVLMNERFGGNAWILGMRTLTTETPDPTGTEFDIAEQKPGGLKLDYDTADGFTYDSLTIIYDTFGEVKDDYATYAALKANTP